MYNKLYNGKNLKKARKAAGITQEQLGKATGIDRQTINKWENSKEGEPKISISNFIEIYKYYGGRYSFDYLLGLSDYTSTENDAIGKATGLSNASIEALRKWKDGSRTHEKLKMPLDGLAVIRLKMLNFLLENENIGLLDTLYNCIFGKFLDDNKYIELDSGTTVLGATNRTLQNAFIPSVTVCIEDLRDIAEHGQTEKAHQLIEKRHDVIAAKTNK